MNSEVAVVEKDPNFIEDFKEELITKYKISKTDAIFVCGIVEHILHQQRNNCYKWLQNNLNKINPYCSSDYDCHISNDDFLKLFNEAYIENYKNIKI